MPTEEEKINLSIPVTVFGELTSFNNVISKARVRIFYKGLNRNGTYISDEFAEKLLSTIRYTPICGIYEDDDFTDHGKNRSIAKAYGVVPENPNITWEKHLDEDGVERVYACADVFLWTARYKEASEIVGKSQSMELYDKSIKGIWKYENGKKYFEFTDGCFIGLTPLGDDVEPCFEGSAFYTLAASLYEMVEELRNYDKTSEKNLKGGQEKMVVNFKLSDNEKASAIWNLLNPNFSEEGGWEIAYSLCDVYDDYALVYEYETRNYYRAKYTKNDESDSVTLGEKERTYIMDVSESELTSLKAIKVLNGDSFEKIDENFSEYKNSKEQLNAINEEVKEFAVKAEKEDASLKDLMESYSHSIETSNTFSNENTQLKGQIETLQETIKNLSSEKTVLETYKLEKENSEKQALLDQYKEKLDEEVVKDFSQKINEYTVENLKKELALKLVESDPTIFSNTHLIPQSLGKEDDSALSPAARLIKKHRRNKNDKGGDE